MGEEIQQSLGVAFSCVNGDEIYSALPSRIQVGLPDGQSLHILVPAFFTFSKSIPLFVRR